MKEVGKIITESKVRTDPELRAVKEKEGVFDLEAEQKIVDQMIG